MSAITRLEAVRVDSISQPPGWRDVFGHVAVRVVTESGGVGYGVAGGGDAALSVINKLLPDVLVGEELDDVGRLTRLLRRSVAPYGRSGLGVMATSGVDLALWDALARVQERSVASLLGAPDTEMPGYDTDPAWPSRVPDAGTVAMKFTVPPGQGAAWSLRRIAEFREFLGTDVGLMLDVGTRWDRATAEEFLSDPLARELRWLEEPLDADDLEGYRALRAAGVPIAAGEHEHGVASFVRLFDHEAVDVVQPDVTWCGGLSVLVDVAKMARESGVDFAPHRGGEAWALPAIHAYGGAGALVESPRPWLGMLDAPVRRGPGGGLRTPNAAGFGVDLAEAGWPA